MGNLVITNKGRELMAEMIAGTSTGTFTRVCTSACDCSGMELEELTGLPDIKQEAAVSKVSRIDTVQVEVLAAINNRGLEEGYYVRGIGLYASGPDGEEILYGVSVESEHPDYMPAFGGRTVSGITYRLNVKVDNSEQITIEVNPAAVSTVEQVEAVQAAVDTHTEGTVCSEDGVHGFRFYNNLPQVYREESKAWIDANAASGNTARTVTKAVYEERLAAYQKDSTYKDPDSGLPFADTLYYVEDDYQDMERQAENIRYTDTCALGSANLQGIIDIIAEKVKTQLLSRSDVADNLLSTATDLPLSANQGSILNSKIEDIGNNTLDFTNNSGVSNYNEAIQALWDMCFPRDVTSLIPKMTSNSTSSNNSKLTGICSCSTHDGSVSDAYKAFDKVTGADNYYFAARSAIDFWLQYTFPVAVSAEYVIVTSRGNYSADNEIINAKLQYSDDGETFIDCASIGTITGQTGEPVEYRAEITDNKRHKYWRLTGDKGSKLYMQVGEMQLYGYLRLDYFIGGGM